MTMHRRREHRGRLRKDAQRFPYDPIFIGGKVVMPAELQRIHRTVLDATGGASIFDERRAIVAMRWPDFVKLPPASE